MCNAGTIPGEKDVDVLSCMTSAEMSLSSPPTSSPMARSKAGLLLLAYNKRNYRVEMDVLL